MNKILISWVAFNTDFKAGEVDTTNSPNYQYHKYFFNHDLHIILSSAEKEDLRAEKLINKICKDFPEHNAEIRYLNIRNVIDLTEIKPKVENLLLKYADSRIDIFFSSRNFLLCRSVGIYVIHL